MPIPFRDRTDAGQQLAAHLSRYRGRPDVIVLGLPRGGIPVAAEVAEALDAPLDAFLVRKLGVPGHEELAMGAIASGGLRVLNESTVRDLGIPGAAIDAVEASERRELARRERLYRGARPPLDVAGKTVILVDDGLATGSTMRAGALALRELHPAWLVGAVPVASRSVCDAMRDVVDEMVCAETPEPFYAVGLWYDNFGQTSDDEVRTALARAERRMSPAPFVPSEEKPAPEPRPGLEARDAIAHVSHPLQGERTDHDPLLEQIGTAEIVLLGEATHGTHEFYRERAAITRRLIAERGFNAVAVEADWPDASRVNRFVRGESDDADAERALGDFERFPRWMWRNDDVLAFVRWLREHNDALPTGTPKTGFYGVDLYSLHRSIEAVIAYLDKVDPEAGQRARARYACFDDFGDNPQIYGQLVSLGVAEDCENEVVGQLVEMQRLAHGPGTVGARTPDAAFFAEQNARVARNAEAYYRAMFRGRSSSWNLRDTHMADTVDALVTHLTERDGYARIAIWAHNSHLGDARATEMGVNGEVNLGQLMRQRHPRQTYAVGFSTYDGTVTAAADWDGPARRRRVLPGLPGSYEELLHEASAVAETDILLPLHGDNAAIDALMEPRLQRAIGVVYKPETERFSHYFHAILPRQFDAVLHLDRTSAVQPLDRDSGFEAPDEVPETWPFGV
jgi:erythromycin esterase-like protein/predicted phosphoribosyltransferase